MDDGRAPLRLPVATAVECLETLAAFVLLQAQIQQELASKETAAVIRTTPPAAAVKTAPPAAADKTAPPAAQGAVTLGVRGHGIKTGVDGLCVTSALPAAAGGKATESRAGAGGGMRSVVGEYGKRDGDFERRRNFFV